MTKRLSLFLLFLLILVASSLEPKPALAALAHTCADPALTTFSDGLTSKTVTIPAGGGTVEAARIKLPMGSTVCSASTTISKAGGAGAGTPYIWIPATTQHKLIQLKTSDGSLVHVFRQGADNCTASDFIYPSRITVIPGGDVWVGNRLNSNNVTRLGKKAGCVDDGDDDCYECKGTYPTCGNESKGVTFDSDFNIWAGAWTGSCLVRLCGHTDCTDVNGAGGYNIGDKMAINAAGNKQINGFSVYGLIGDSYGNIWSASGPNVTRVDINDAAATAFSTAVGSIYGIGMDNEGDIWIGRQGNTGIWGIDGEDAGGAGIGVIEPAEQCPTAFTNTGLAVDGNNNVWSTGYSGNAVYVVKGENCGQIFYRKGVCTHDGHQPHGMAIDADNHAWLLCDTGEAIKYAFHDDGDVIVANDGNDDIEELQRINLWAIPGVGCSNASGDTYNYSDMTGFRTPKISITIGNFPPIVATNYPQVINDANYPGFSASLNTTFQTCSCSGCRTTTDDLCGNLYCEAPITISSTFLGGDWTLSDLKIHYKDPASKVGGGLVPCGRRCDDPSTAIREDASCTLCHLFILAKRVVDFLLILVISVAILMFVVGGIMLVFAAENPQRANQAKALLTAAVIGLVVIFAAWLIVNALVFFLVEGKAPLTTQIGKIFTQPWNQFNCPVK